MLYLAQVHSKQDTHQAEFQLLARQRLENVWELVQPDDKVLSVEGITELNTGVLVLLELSETRQVQTVQDATPWILDIIDQFLSYGITPALLQQETERAEQWRQSLTLQSQELGRRILEMEARRDQIQELEENLKQEKLQLEELVAAQLRLNQSDSTPEDIASQAG